MRYYSKGTEREWKEIVVVCEGCHSTYHDAEPKMPATQKTRASLLNEMAIVLMKKNICDDFFLTNGTRMAKDWLDYPVEMGTSKRPTRQKFEKLTKKDRPKTHQIQGQSPLKKWKKNPGQFTREQAKAFIENFKSPLWDSIQFREKYGIPNPPPRKWQKELRRVLMQYFGMQRPRKGCGRNASD